MTQRTVLALDLSTPHGQLAVVRGQAVLFEREFVSDRSHNSMLYAPLAEALVACRDVLNLIAVGVGPGSYTGVRIAIAAAQGVALSKKVPLLGWSSLATLSDAVQYQVVGDARRGQAYHAKVNGQRLLSLEVLPMSGLASAVQAELPAYTADLTVPSGFESAQLVLPSAKRLGLIVAALDHAELEHLAQQHLEPHYVQEAFITEPKKRGLG
jgi:tRNA threonylcarbamoyl adenosine modification protein YeaZ